jgi:KUP system potassium uptake protein
MLITTLLTFFVIRFGWGYSLTVCLLSTSFFLIVDCAFFAANLIKFVEGGWFPLAMGGLVFTIMLTWRTGRDMLFSHLSESSLRLESFLKTLFDDPPHRVGGTAIFLIGDSITVPHALLHNLKHNKVLHERIVFLTVIVRDVPHVPFEARVSLEALNHCCFRMRLYYGFKDMPDVPQTLALCKVGGEPFNTLETSFFVSRETVIPTPGGGMALWRERLFAMMARNAGSVVDYFSIPANRVIELGTQVEI